MAKLFYIDFDADSIKLDLVYKNKDLLAEMRSKSTVGKSIPKIDAVYHELYFPAPPPDRPYTVSSIVLSADGKMAFHDMPAGPMIAKQNFFDADGALADFWVLNAVRVFSDGIIMGARTLQTEENNTSHIFDPELAEQRRTILGKPEHPHNIIVSFDGTDIPLDHLIFNIDKGQGFHVMIATSPEGGKYIATQGDERLKIFGGRELESDQGMASLKAALQDDSVIPVVTTGEGTNPDTGALLSCLKTAGMEQLLIESPTYTSHLMANGMLDEYFINYSFVYAGGEISPNRGNPFSGDNHPHAKLVTLATHGPSFVYTRQRLYYGINAEKDLSDLKY